MLSSVESRGRPGSTGFGQRETVTRGGQARRAEQAPAFLGGVSTVTYPYKLQYWIA
jgi:hypothetical protein